MHAHTSIHVQKPVLIPIMDFQSPAAKCFLFPGVLYGSLYLCVCKTQCEGHEVHESFGAKLTVYLNVEFLADRRWHVVLGYAQVLAHVSPVHIGKLQRITLNSG